MKSFLFIPMTILVFCVAAFAQTDVISPCPTIDVRSPAGVTAPGEAAIFTADLGKEAENFILQYKWTASNGRIIGGQGTLAVEVLQENFNKGLRLSLDIVGLPKECPNSDSETMSIAIHYVFEPVDEFSIAASQINKARLSNFAVKLQNDPSATGYIIEKFAEKTSQKTVEQKNLKIINYLKTKGIEKDRIVLLNASTYENLTQLVLVPAGAPPPNCDECITVQPN